MIRVNLLPKEYRKRDRTPMARMGAIVGGVAMVAAAAGFWAYYHFTEVVPQEEKLQQRNDELNTKWLPQANRSRQLLTELNEYKQRRVKIEEIGAGRILWSKKLDQLADLVDNDGQSDPYLIWLSSINGTSGGPRGGGAITMAGYSGGLYGRLSNANRAFKVDGEGAETAFFEDFASLTPPRGDRQDFGDGLEPDTAFSFSWVLPLKPPGWRGAQK